MQSFSQPTPFAVVIVAVVIVAFVIIQEIRFIQFSPAATANDTVWTASP